MKKVKIDLHIHSCYSNNALLGLFNLKESNLLPKEIYKVAIERGMDFVTITDHNTIMGALQLKDKRNFIIGEEVAVSFPEDGTLVHLIILGVTGEIHSKINELSSNIYKLIEFLDNLQLFYFLAHPVYPVNRELKLEHFEKLLLLCPFWEVSNSFMITPAGESFLLSLPEKLYALPELAKKHNLPLKHSHVEFLATSGAHTSLDIGKGYVEVECIDGDILTALRCGRFTMHPYPATPAGIAHSIYILSSHYLKKSFALNLHPFVKPIAYLFYPLSKIFCEHKILSEWLNKIRLDNESLKFFTYIFGREINHEELFELVEIFYQKRVKKFLNEIKTKRLKELLPQLSMISSLYFFLFPYFAGFFFLSRQKNYLSKIIKGKTETSFPAKVAIFTDIQNQIHGINVIMQRLQEYKNLFPGKLILVKFSPDTKASHNQEGVLSLIESVKIPFYENLLIEIPSFLEILNFLYTEDIKLVHINTSGFVGLASLIGAKLLGIPVLGFYHTNIPQYINTFLEDYFLIELSWSYLKLFYNICDTIMVPSFNTAKLLAEKGFEAKKIKVFSMGVDTELFNPRKRSQEYRNYLGFKENDIVLSFVGRISREKNIDLLFEVFRKLKPTNPELKLLIVGDGLYREELQREIKRYNLGSEVKLVGFLSGERLASAFASSDIFVFPSNTDTLGNVVLEAQASGLPVVVSDVGGPQENVKEEVTGFICKANDVEEFSKKILLLAKDRLLREKMGRNSRQYTEEKSWNKAFEGLFNEYKSLANN